MWDVLVRTPRGSNNPRKFSMLLATFFVALLGYIFATTPSAYAADATWDGNNISHAGNTYTPTTPDGDLPNDIKSSPAVYQYTDTSQDPDLVYFIYFAGNTQDAKSEKEATYVRYTLNPPNRYINEFDKKTITLTPVEASATEDTSDGAFTDTCTLDGIGWLVCPVMQGLAEGMDFVYNRIRGFLTVQPITTSVDNPVYRIWVYSRDLANIAFVIGFMVIIYSYLVGGGFNGYEIRKILPRLAVAAILINVSYIVCALAVDISNIAGYGVNQLFENVRDEVLPGSSAGPGANVNWTSVTAWVLAGGVGAAAGASLLPGIAGGGAATGALATGLWYLLAPFLFGAALLIMVTFFILAARQAIIIVLIAIAPLAFAAFILPNTEKWFERWRGLFFTMLVMFPAFGAVFGGAQLAGEVIIRTATSIEQIILGLGVMVAPLAITPLLLKLGGGILNRFGGVINNPRKGLYDRYKNYNQDRLAEQRASAQKNNANMLAAGSFKRRQFVRRRAATNFAKKNYRDEQKKQDEEAAMNAWHRQTGRYGYSNDDERGSIKNSLGRRQNGYGNLDTYHRDNKLDHDATEAHHEKAWQGLVKSDPARMAMQTQTRFDERLAKITQEGMADADEKTITRAVNEDARYAGYRATQVQSVVDKGIAQNATKAIEADGSAQLAETILSSDRLKKQVIRTHEQQSRAQQANELIEDAAKANWEKTSLEDRTIYSRQLERQGNAKNLKSLQAEWDSILAEAASGVVNDYNQKFGPMTQGVSASIDMIARSDENMAVEQFRKERAEYVGKVQLNKDLKGNAALLERAAGIDAEGGVKVLASLQKEASALHMQNVEAIKSVFTNDSRYNNDALIKIYREGVLPDNSKASLSQRHAAIQRLMLETGNNYAAQDIVDFSHEIGVNEENGQFKDIFGNDLTQDEVDNRRDMQQIINDAAGRSKLKVDWYTGTDRGNAETGRHIVKDKDFNIRTDFAGSEMAIAGEINKGKVDFDRAFGADIDVIDKQARVLADPRVRDELLETEAARQYADTLEEFLKDPLTGMKLEKRKRGSYHVLLAELRSHVSGDPVDLTQLEQEYTDVATGEVRAILEGNRISRKPSSRKPTGPISLD